MTGNDIDARATTISSEEAAERLGVKASTLNNMRWQGRGPLHIKVGGRVRYRLVDIAAYLDAQTRSSTSASLTTNGRRAAKGD